MIRPNQSLATTEVLLAPDAEALRTMRLAGAIVGAQVLPRDMLLAGEVLDAALQYARHCEEDPGRRAPHREAAMDAMAMGGAVVSLVADREALEAFHTLCGQFQDRPAGA